MAVYQSLQMAVPKYPVSGPGIGGRSTKIERAVVDFSNLGSGGAQSVAIGDTIQLFKLHPKFRVLRGFVKVETAAAASSTYTIGDAGGAGVAADPARYFASASAAATGTNQTLAETGRDFLVSPNTPGGKGQYLTVNMTWAGAASGTTGRIIVLLEGYIEEPA